MPKTKDFKQGKQVFDSFAIPASSTGPAGFISSNVGSAMKLLEDIKRDGFQWKDLGNFAVNSGLDLMYMYPGMGIVANQKKNTASKEQLSKLGSFLRIASTGNNEQYIPNANQIYKLTKKES